MPTFKYDSQTAFLTYPQCDLGINELIDELRKVQDILWARVCREKHDDGNPHLHAVLKFTKRVQSRQARIFDVKGYHPNIQSVRSIKKSLDYVAKDGEFTDIGPVPTAGSAMDVTAIWELAANGTEEEYWKAAANARLPYQYACKFRAMQNTSKTEEIPEDYVGDQSRECAVLQLEPLLRNLQIEVVVGPSGCGKSSWAKRVAPKPALWVSHIDVLRGYRPAYHKSIIFDDMTFKHLPVQAQIHLVDWHDSRQIHCRYGYATIPAETVKIFTCNEYPFSDHPAIERRVNLIQL